MYIVQVINAGFFVTYLFDPFCCSRMEKLIEVSLNYEAKGGM